MEPGLGREDVASDRFASADLASLGGAIYRQHIRVGTPTAIKTAFKGDLYLYTHVSLVILPWRIGLTAYP